MRYQPAFDGLRAAAVVAVVAVHVAPVTFPGGWLGVDVFFVLSGFLITRNILGEMNTSGSVDYRRFYLRRCLRLIPALGCLLVADLLRILLTSPEDALSSVLLSATYLMNWNLAFGWLNADVLGHTWSLAAEEQFYILWPLALALIFRRRPLLWIVGFIAAAVLWRIYLVAMGVRWERIFFAFDTHSDGILIGCAMALAPLGDNVKRWATRTALIPIAFFAVALFALAYWSSVFAQTLGVTVAGLCAAWLIIAAAQSGWISSILAWGPMIYVGRISYGWYLWHYPIIHLLHDTYSAWVSVLGIPISFAAAAASYRYIELPCLALKERLRPTSTAKVSDVQIARSA